MKIKKRQKPIFFNIAEINEQIFGLDSPPLQEATLPPEATEDQPDLPLLQEISGISPAPQPPGPEPMPTAEPDGLAIPDTYPGVAAAPGSTGSGPNQGQEQEADRDPLLLNPPSVRLTEDSHDFGHLIVGQSKDWEILIHNDGDAQLAVAGLDGLPAQGFKLAPPPLLPLIISGHGQVRLNIQFVPEQGGEKRARLLVRTDQPAAPVTEVGLTGMAIGVIATDQGIYYSPIFNYLNMSFVYIRAGSFLMGSPETEPGRQADELQHEVTITQPFYLQTTPVTQGQWRAIMGSNPSKFSNGGDNCPVEGVSWHDCQEFLQRLNSREEGTYRLPSEAEWEYACRAETATAFANGDITQLFCDHDPSLDAAGWYCYNADRRTHPVGEKQANPWGLYDMHGQVGEWCQDWYGEYAPTPETDPKGLSSGTERVVRGGSWFASSKKCRSASRFKWPPHSKNNLQIIGFRLVREV